MVDNFSENVTIFIRKSADFTGKFYVFSRKTHDFSSKPKNQGIDKKISIP